MIDSLFHPFDCIPCGSVGKQCLDSSPNVICNESWEHQLMLNAVPFIASLTGLLFVSLGVLFWRAWRCRVLPNIVAYNAAISACEKSTQWEQALQLLQA